MHRNEHILELLGGEERCPYLPDETARMQYKVIERCSGETYLRLLEHGWRRFGRVFFRPACAECSACKSLRVDVASFAANRSMRRCWRANGDLRLRLARPSVSDQRLTLFMRYHQAQAERKGWEARPATPASYHRGFVEGYESFGYELAFYDRDRLIAVALLDLLPRAISAVYCYYDPAASKRSLGVYSLLNHIALARQRAIPAVYLGYWVAENASLAYKARYRPHALLVGRPDEDEPALWRPGGASESAR